MRTQRTCEICAGPVTRLTTASECGHVIALCETCKAECPTALRLCVKCEDKY